jgi:hypothetical protein
MCYLLSSEDIVEMWAVGAVQLRQRHLEGQGTGTRQPRAWDFN